MKRRLLALCALTISLMIALPATAFACGGLIAGRHAEVLRRATTLAAWTDGIEHYVTCFQFAGTANSFGYIIPLPAAPSHIRKGGDWTLERLERESFPQAARETADAGGGTAVGALSSVRVLQHVKVDSLDIKVVQGGGRDVAAWAREHGFDLTSDTDAVLGSYKANIFALAKFDNAGSPGAGKQLVEGQGVVIDFEIPLPQLWVPLRILSLGKVAAETVDAHLFLLTPSKPFLSPAPESLRGMRIAHDDWTSPELIADLRSDKGTKWVPGRMWLTALELSAQAPTVKYDLTAWPNGIVPAGPVGLATTQTGEWTWTIIAGGLAALAAGFTVRGRFRDATRRAPSGSGAAS